MKTKLLWMSEVAHGHINYVLVRPPFLTDGTPKGSAHVLTGDEIAHEITRADLAQFLVDQLENDTYLSKTVTVAHT